MKEFAIDLHMHTPLSPCGQDSMVPEAVVSRCLDMGLDVIAITDHNTSGNVRPFWEEGQEKGLIVVPGMELQTQEDIHLVCLFETPEILEAWERELQPFIPPQQNDSRYFGHQHKLSRQGTVIGEESRMLLASMSISVDQAVSTVHEYGGLCIAAHIDRQGFSLWTAFGLIPAYIPFDGIELTCHLPREEAQLAAIRALGYRYLTAGDAHHLEGIGPIHCAAFLAHWSLPELALAMKGLDGRDIEVAR